MTRAECVAYFRRDMAALGFEVTVSMLAACIARLEGVPDGKPPEATTWPVEDETQQRPEPMMQELVTKAAADVADWDLMLVAAVKEAAELALTDLGYRYEFHREQ